MRVFRSEDHVRRWLRAGNPVGETMSLDRQWSLAKQWFAGRDHPSWKKRSPEEAEAVFRRVGLESDFWRL